MSIFQQCVELNPDGGDALLQCIADTAEENVAAAIADLAEGLDTFFLIFA